MSSCVTALFEKFCFLIHDWALLPPRQKYKWSGTKLMPMRTSFDRKSWVSWKYCGVSVSVVQKQTGMSTHDQTCWSMTKSPTNPYILILFDKNYSYRLSKRANNPFSMEYMLKLDTNPELDPEKHVTLNLW